MQQIALVVDDSRVARMTLSKLLVAHGLEVIELGSGEDALAYLQKDNVKPDIIFMDVMMGGMDGLAATQKIKADSNINHIPVVVCTGHESDSDTTKALAVGAVATLTKPPKADALDALIEELEQHIESVRKESIPEVDSVALLAEIMAMIEKDYLPVIKQDLLEVTETLSRQISNETIEKYIPEPVSIDENALFSKVINTVEKDFLPRIQNDIRVLTEEISRQISSDIVEKRIAEHISSSDESSTESAVDETTLVSNIISTVESDLLPKMHRDIREMTEDISRQVATDAVEEAVQEKVQIAVDGILPLSADNAIQNKMSEFNVPEKLLAMLNSEGEEWLHRHEQQVFEQLQGQIEEKFAPMVMKYLNEHLEQMMTPIAHTVVEAALANEEAIAEIEAETDMSLPSDDINELKHQLSVLKVAVIGLGGMVALLAVAMIF